LKIYLVKSDGFPQLLIGAENEDDNETLTGIMAEMIDLTPPKWRTTSQLAWQTGGYPLLTVPVYCEKVGKDG